MAKLTEQVLISWLHGNKPIDKLLKTTRSTIDSVEQFVNSKLKGDVQAKWIEKIAEYKKTNSGVSSAKENAAFSEEEEYMNLKNELSLVEKELADTEQQKAKLKEEFEEAFNKLCSKSNELTDKRGDLLGEIEELEQNLVINLVFDDTRIDKSVVKYFVTFKDAIADLEIDENEVGDLLAKNFMHISPHLYVKEAILVVKNAIFIKKSRDAGRSVRVYGPAIIIDFIKNCDVLNNYDIETIVTNKHVSKSS